MDHQVKKDHSIWTMMEDFSRVPGGQDLSKMKSQYAMFVDGLGLTSCIIYYLGT